MGAIAADHVYPTSNLKRLIDGLAEQPRPHLLDIGRLCGRNIEWLVHRGFKVTVDDRLTSMKPPAPPLNKDRPKGAPTDDTPVLNALDYPPNSFDAILCWDLFDYLEIPRAHQAAARLGALLKPKGLLFTLFNCNRAAPRFPTRYHILQDDRLEYEPIPPTMMHGRVYENREIQELFSAFDLLNSRFLRNQMREVLVQKKPVPRR